MTGEGFRYKIEILVYTFIVQTFETDSYKEARRFYQLHDQTWRCYPQVYVDGKPLNKAKSDKLFYAGQFRETFQSDAELAKILKQYKR